MKKTLLSLAMTASLGMLAASASASPINVGGVVWDPDAVFNAISQSDFTSHGSVVEIATNGSIGDTVSGFGRITQINAQSPNASAMCPGCELTYTFSMKLANLTPLGGSNFSFGFNNLAVNVYVDTLQDYAATYATSSNGNLWLSLAGRADPVTGYALNGLGRNIGSGSDSGSGDALLDVTGGLAMGNFDTNTKLTDADMVFSSSFQPAGATDSITGRQLLAGTVDLTGNSIPEPGSLALLGLGLVGLAAARRRKAA